MSGESSFRSSEYVVKYVRSRLTRISIWPLARVVSYRKLECATTSCRGCYRRCRPCRTERHRFPWIPSHVNQGKMRKLEKAETHESVARSVRHVRHRVCPSGRRGDFTVELSFFSLQPPGAQIDHLTINSNHTGR